MDHPHRARRSASHGALSRSYSGHGDAAARVCSSQPFIRPLRALRGINENTTLLPSPGPLESMLKTTTETGDIGIFSIRPMSSISMRRAPLRPILNNRDTRLARGAMVDVSDTVSLHDDRRRLPSYRDTASEIISMYGSESQRSVSSSLSPRVDSIGQRSYSMTSCSSRAIPNLKSSGTLQSQSSGGGSLLQRPRSPFPYPTRLKRPGVRPASPALTENGSVDYSRMVEIDRVSHRTVHGSYRPTCSPNTRRFGPGHTRLEPPRYCHSPLTHSAAGTPNGTSRRLSSAHGPRVDQFRDRLGSSASENSGRTISITSIVDMYQHPGVIPAQARHYPPAQAVGSFYYDYSEDFDMPRARSESLGDHLSPVPTRAASMCRPTILDDDSGPQLEATFDSDDSALAPLLELPSPQQSPQGHNSLGQCSRVSSTVPRRAIPDNQLDNSVAHESLILQEVHELSSQLAKGTGSAATKPSSSPPLTRQLTEGSSAARPMLVGLSEDNEKAILSPTPISPARNLRVRNSITHMDTRMERMEKTLPPLPGTGEGAATSKTITSSIGKRKAIRNRLSKWAKAIRTFFGR